MIIVYYKAGKDAGRHAGRHAGRQAHTNSQRTNKTHLDHHTNAYKKTKHTYKSKMHAQTSKINTRTVHTGHTKLYDHHTTPTKIKPSKIQNFGWTSCGHTTILGVSF